MAHKDCALANTASTQVRAKTAKCYVYAVINITCTSCHHILAIQLFTVDGGRATAWRGALAARQKSVRPISNTHLPLRGRTVYKMPATQRNAPFPSHFRARLFSQYTAIIIFCSPKSHSSGRDFDKIVLVCCGCYMLGFAWLCMCGASSSVVREPSCAKCSNGCALYITY